MCPLPCSIQLMDIFQMRNLQKTRTPNEHRILNKLALVLSRVFEHASRINVDEYFHGKYDQDTNFLRFDDIKAAIYDPANATIYPYCDPQVRRMIKAGLCKLESNLGNIRASARELGNENMKFSDYLLHKSVDVRMIIVQMMAMNREFITVGSQSFNPAVRCYMKINRENMRNSFEWITDLKQRKDAGAQWG